MRIAYLGPEGTNTHEALLATGSAAPDEFVPMPTIHDCVVAVQAGMTERAFVPIENAVEGSVNATLDAIAVETHDVEILAEAVHPIHTCLIARDGLDLSAIASVMSHPHANAQCARFLRTRVPQARVLAASSTAEAVRAVAQEGGAAAALGSRIAAQLYDCEVLVAGVDDVEDNETRFVMLGPAGAEVREQGPQKTAIVFWGMGAEAPGWLASCLAELASRGVNLTRIESRPRKQGLGRYMFFADLEGHASERPVREALDGLRRHVEQLRVLGSFPAA